MSKTPTIQEVSMQLSAKRSTNRKRNSTWEPYGFLFPAALLMFGIIVYPVIYNLYMSFFRVGLGGMSTRKWVFLQNFQYLLNSNIFWEITRNTLVWVVVLTVVIQLMALGGALLLNRRIRGRAIYRAILLLPWVLPGVVTGILWKYMFDGEFGVVNDVLMRLGFIQHYVPWLSQGSTSLYAIMVAYVWKVFPLTMVIILGSLQGIPEEIYEAAEIEGAGRWQTLRYVVLPLLKGAMISTTIFTVILAFNSFDLTYVMTDGGPVNSSEILGLYIYDLGFTQFDFGSAAATATLMFLVSLLLIGFYVRRQSRQEED